MLTEPQALLRDAVRARRLVEWLNNRDDVRQLLLYAAECETAAQVADRSEAARHRPSAPALLN